MYNPVDMIWLGKMYYSRQLTHNLDKKMPIVSVPIMVEIAACNNAPVSKEKDGIKNRLDLVVKLG